MVQLKAKECMRIGKERGYCYCVDLRASQSPSFSSIALSFLAPLGVAAAPCEATTAQLTSP